ncbi:Cobalt-precorrin 5A hydrolase (EC [Olavius sp. associated proteobacterium Delta 1]|nr:Cobalt-precorrin 5A hydrolase (EC [Olavius sp. associated proteobacterium Delta 1]
MVASKTNNVAVWALTPNGQKLAGNIRRKMTGVDVYLSQNISAGQVEHLTFQKLSETLKNKFDRYGGHIFIMSTGIVVRLIAPLIKHKTEDPAVVVVDDGGNHAISLLSGHLGGANELTRQIAATIGARPVITTATDVNQVPAIDLLAKEKNLLIENPAAIKTVNMALLTGNKIMLCDPHNFLKNTLPDAERLTSDELMQHVQKNCQHTDIVDVAYVLVDDLGVDLPVAALILRPASLVAGIGCNRSTEAAEILAHLADVLAKNNLARSSLKGMASIDVKADENGLILAAENLKLPLTFFSKLELNQVKNIENPSEVVEKHVGVKSVCEAAAILATRNGTLVVPKQSTKNVTVAIARINFLSSE